MHFVRERAAELDQRAPVIKPVAIEEAIQTRLDPIAEGLKDKRGENDGDDIAGRAGGPSGLEQLANQRSQTEVERHHSGRRHRVSQAALENNVNVHQPVADDGVSEAQRNQRQRKNRKLHPRSQHHAQERKEERSDVGSDVQQ